MAILIDQFPLREGRSTPTVHATEKWPGRHPRAKRRTCNLCTAGDRCGDHSPAAMRKAGAS